MIQNKTFSQAVKIQTATFEFFALLPFDAIGSVELKGSYGMVGLTIGWIE